MSGKGLISEAERELRQKVADAALYASRAMGFSAWPEVDELNRQYIAGEISGEELSEAMQKLTGKGLISAAEQERRRKAVNYARTSVRLEGFILSPDVEELNRQYIAGEISSDEHTAAILALNP